MKKNILILIVAVVAVFMAGCQPKTPETTDEVYSKTNFVLGTVVTVTLYDNGSDELLDKAFARLLEIENLMSANLDASEIGRINLMAGKEAVTVSEETFNVIEQSLYYGDISKGTFDITMEPVVDLWKIGTDEARVPSANELNDALTKVDYRLVELDEDNKTVFLPEEGMGLDLGGIAKGYAADELVKLLVNEGVSSAMLNLGGNVFAMGSKLAPPCARGTPRC